jgi:hypothetical protein
VTGFLQIRISIILFIVISVRIVSKENTVSQTNLGVIYFTVYRIAFITDVARGKKEVYAPGSCARLSGAMHPGSE